MMNNMQNWYLINDFLKAFLKKFYHIHKIALIGKNIMQFKKETAELFWKYFERFKDLLTQCPRHVLEKWRLYQILYDDLDSQNKTFLETMCQERF